MTATPLQNALDAIAGELLTVRGEYALLPTLPDAVVQGRRAAILDYYAALEEAAASLRQIMPAPREQPLVEHVPPSRLAKLPKRAKPQPARVTEKVTRQASWWTKPTADFKAETDRIRRASVVSEHDLVQESRRSA